MATRSGFSNGWEGFVDHKWIKKGLLRTLGTWRFRSIAFDFIVSTSTRVLFASYSAVASLISHIVPRSPRFIRSTTRFPAPQALAYLRSPTPQRDYIERIVEKAVKYLCDRTQGDKWRSFYHVTLLWSRMSFREATRCFSRSLKCAILLRGSESVTT